MKCEYCENELPGAVGVCPFCGGAVTAASAPDARASATAQPPRGAPRGAAESEGGQGDADRLRDHTAGDANKSPYKRAIFLVLGIFLCFWGVQFLYVNRFICFAVMMACFAVASLFPEYDWVGGLSTTVSFVATFLIKTDSKKRKMAWF